MFNKVKNIKITIIDEGKLQYIHYTYTVFKKSEEQDKKQKVSAKTQALE